MKIETRLSASDTEKMMIAKGYALMSPTGFIFERLFSETEKEENVKVAQSVSPEEWEKRCEEVGIYFSNLLTEVRDIFAGKYDIHQINEENSSRSHYASDWDLFYASNKITPTNHISTFSLSLNSKRDAERNFKLTNELTELIKSLPYENLCCYVLYEAILDEEKIKAEMERIESTRLNEPATYCSRKGHIRYLGKSVHTQENLYGFYPHRCKKMRHILKDADILALILTGQLANYSV